MKKRFLAMVLVACMLLAACGVDEQSAADEGEGTPNNSGENESEAEKETGDPDEKQPETPKQEIKDIEQEATTITVDTDYYTVEIPKAWETDGLWKVFEGESYDYTLSFYEKQSHDELNAGFLFSIDLFTEFEDYTYYPSYEVLGSVEVYRIGGYNIIATYPTDVQFSEKTVKKYNKMASEIPQVLKSLKVKEECSFSAEPLEVVITQEPAEIPDAISGSYVGSWEMWQIASTSAPMDALRWMAEFREDGTGRFVFVFEGEISEAVDFTYVPYNTAWQQVTGLELTAQNGTILYYMAQFNWSDEQQGLLMTLYESTGLDMDLDHYWVFQNS